MLFWLLAELVGGSGNAAVLMGFIPARLSGMDISPAAPALLTPLTAALVHGGFLHLAFNMLMLLWCGTAVERVLGRGSLILIYVVSAFVAAGAQWATDPGALTPMIGASGAISGVVGAFALSFGRAKQIVGSPRLNRFLNALWLLVAWVVIQVMMSFIAGGQGVLLATAAHVGGFVAGLLIQRPLLLWRFRRA